MHHPRWQADLDKMTHHQNQRGGVTVGHLDHVGPVENAVVMLLRLWGEDGHKRAALRRSLSHMLGTENGPYVFDRFAELCFLCAQYGRRPLIRHAPDCRCLGADESCMAHFIATAGQGQREDAMMMATLILRPDMAPAAAGLAEQIGIALAQMTANRSVDVACTHPASSVHLH